MVVSNILRYFGIIADVRLARGIIRAYARGIERVLQNSGVNSNALGVSSTN
jgi:hypothetical protein